MPIAEVARRMLDTYPRDFNIDRDLLVECITACFDCAQACTQCADDCLSEPDVAQLVKCIRTNLDCADVCDAFATLGSRRTGSNEEVIRKLLDACITACRVCGEECQRHASKHEHCRVCAESCRQCETACQSALRSM